MEPTLRDGDLTLVAKRPRRRLARGRIAAFRAPASAGGMIQVKRVVGLPGERVEFCEGSLFIDGAHHPEPYLGGLPANVGLDSAAWTLGADEYFAMGDNRARSADSRRYGPIRADDVLGAVVARIWPPRRRSRFLPRYSREGGKPDGGRRWFRPRAR